MANLWWYAEGSSHQGPLQAAEVNKLISERKISSDTLLWTEGMSEWLPLSAVPASSGLIRTIPPPLPSSIREIRISEIPISVGVPASAGRRFLARLIDVWSTSIVLAVLLGAGLSLASEEFSFWIQRPQSDAIFGLLVILPLAFVADAGVYGLFGNTLGKKLLRVRVSSTDGRPLSFAAYLKRNFEVWWFGLAAGLPIISLIMMLYQWRRVANREPTGYDIGRHRVDASPLSSGRVVLASLLVLVILALVFTLAVLAALDRSPKPGSY